MSEPTLGKDLYKSSFFTAVLDGPFKESEEFTIDFPTDDPEVIKALLDFLYTDSYVGVETTIGDDDGPASNPTASKKALLFAGNLTRLLLDVDLYQVADRLGIAGLKRKVAEIFPEHLVMACQSPKGDHLRLALSGIVGRVYSATPSTDQGLRQKICEWLAGGHPAVDEALKDPKGREVIESTPGLALGMYEVAAKRAGRRQTSAHLAVDPRERLPMPYAYVPTRSPAFDWTS